MDKPEKHEEKGPRSTAVSFAGRVEQAAKEGTSLEAVPPDEDPNRIRQAIAYICSLYGLNLPQEEDVETISEFLRCGAYRTRTVEELRQAAFASVNGWIDEVIPYRGINAQFLKKLFEAYDEKRKRILSDKVQKLPPSPDISEEEKKANRDKLIEDIIKDFDSLAEGHDIATMPIPHKFDVLRKMGAAEMPDKEEKESLFDRARDELRRRRAAKGGGIRNIIGRSNTVRGEAKLLAYKEALLSLKENGKDIREFIENP